MNLQEAIAALQRLDELSHAYSHAMGTLSVDGETAAPKQSWRGRGSTMAFLAGEMYRGMSRPENREAIAVILQQRNACEHAVVRRAEEFRDRLEEMLLFTAEEYAAYEELVNESQAVWHDAKVNDDYASFAPWLEKLIEHERLFARRKDPSRDPYDVLLDVYEKGACQAKLDPFFRLLRDRLTPVIRAVAARPAPRTDFLRRSYPIAQQRVFSDRLMALMGIDRERCAIAETEHPFTDGANKWDVRITTHYHERDVASSMYSVIHEGGHALYELGVADEWQFTCLGTGSTMGIHESQSRFYENLIGRSEPFCRVAFGILRELFPEQTADVTEDEFYRGVNLAVPSLIRTEADELTYPMHILVRYEMEKRMIAGDVTVAELPALWAELYRKYLGVTVPNDREGILQDSHWSGGAFGYFPSYALGSAYGVQMLEAMERETDVWGAVARGDLSPVTRWLGEHIHQYGRLKTPEELLRSAQVDPFLPEKYVAYLTDKFSALYGL